MIKLFVSEYTSDTVKLISLLKQNGADFEVINEDVGNPFGCPRIEVGSIVASGLDACIDLIETVL